MATSQDQTNQGHNASFVGALEYVWPPQVTPWCPIKKTAENPFFVKTSVVGTGVGVTRTLNMAGLYPS